MSGQLERGSFRNGAWYTNMWPACRKESERPSILVVGRATRNQWGEKLSRPEFPIDLAVDTAARKDMYWVDAFRRSQFIQTALKVVEALPTAFRWHDGPPSLDISWSELYKVARAGNPSRLEMSLQGSLGTGELLTREVEVLKPSLVLAFTQKYSRKTGKVAADGWFEDIMGPCSDPPGDRGGIVRITRIAGVPCIVCPHPQAGPPRSRFIEDILLALKSGFGIS